MQLNLLSHDDVTHVSIHGDLDTNGSRDALARLEPLVLPDARFVIDLSGVRYMSSAGLRFALSVWRRAEAAGGRLVFAGLHPEVRDTMDVTGFLEFFDVFDDIDAALAHLRTEDA